jgi:hypothetical protein
LTPSSKNMNKGNSSSHTLLNSQPSIESIQTEIGRIPQTSKKVVHQLLSSAIWPTEKINCILMTIALKKLKRKINHTNPSIPKKFLVPLSIAMIYKKETTRLCLLSSIKRKKSWLDQKEIIRRCGGNMKNY